MTAAPLPRKPYRDADTGLGNSPDGLTPLASASPADTAPVFALKELVARWYREQNKIQDLLSSLSFALRSFNNLNQFLELIPLVASRVTDTDGSAILLFKPNGSLKLLRLHCQDGMQCQDIRQAIDAATRNISPRLNNASGAASNSLKAPTLANLDAVLCQLVGSDVQLFGTPILVKNIERGRLYVFSRDPDYAWLHTRQKLIRLVADQAAVAIENDELTMELRQKERLDRELEIGAEIQRRLLPRSCPQIEGIELAARCQTANRVGGDYYDFIPLKCENNGEERWLVGGSKICPNPFQGLKHNSGLLGAGVGRDGSNPSTAKGGEGENAISRWSIAIGDVMGKGVPAGLIMTMTRGMLRAEVLNGHSPARILQHLNRVMYADLENSNRFVTLFYSEYDPETQVLSYSNAAHNPPLLWRSATNSIDRLDTLGMLIGLDADSQYQEARVQLEPGDGIIYYTDGFTDAANPQGERFDEENLKNAFAWACRQFQNPQEILDYLFDRVQDFIGVNSSNSDDMTLIVMKVKSLEAEQL
ncbi:MAG TPA: PP2C family protein-serine/threonine phosphatase [Oscillatoriaceae cyanobacterium M33_DOE_052]|uniref:Guanylate cyclase n=1 Tax=Planktothricoides sp. SpSt-374 TaxID=2282167 RepID=A0A7C3ZPM2_9CYAN|nr:PP2C family protein-serine/threonine phosphatase [Oscillatoriaceae cyanobacterium M33_DOE_052]